MNLKKIFEIFKAEGLQILRQKNVFLTLLVYPYLYIPLFVAFVGTVAIVSVNKENQETKIAWIGSENENILKDLNDRDNFSVEVQKNGEASELSGIYFEHWGKKVSFEKQDELYKKAQSLVSKMEMDAMVFSNLDKKDRNRILLVKSKNLDSIRFKFLEKLFGKVVNKENKNIKLKLLSNVGLEEADLSPLALKHLYKPSKSGYSKDQSDPLSRKLILLLFPYILAMIIMSVVYQPVVHCMSEEKELKTIENMLVSPVKVIDLIIGKQLAINLLMLVALVPYISQIFLYKFILNVKVNEFTSMFSSVLDSFTIFKVASLTVVVICFGLLLTSVLFLMVSFSSSKQQAQQMYGMSVLLVLGGVFSTAIFGMDLSLAKMYIPVINFSVFLVNIVDKDIGPSYLIICCLVNLFAAVLMSSFAKEFFEKQYFNLDSRYSINDLLCFGIVNIKKPIAPLGFLVFTIAVGILLTSALIGKSIYVQVCMNIMLGLGMIPLLLLRKYQIKLKDIFPLQKINYRVLFCCIFLGLSLPFFNISLLSLIPGLGEILQNLKLDMNFNYPTWYLLIIMAIVPALYEEFAFRGVILHSFRERFGVKFSILLSSLFFAFMHANAIRFIPTFLIGLILGLVVLKYKNIIYAIVIHFCNNAVGVIMMGLSQSGLAQQKVHSDTLTTFVLSTCLVIFLVWQIMRTIPKIEPQSNHL